MSRSISHKVEELISKTIEENNFELVDVEYVKEGKEWYLRIYIDCEKGVSLDDCELISRKVGDILDEKDIINSSYILEVSSPGIERPLKKEKDFIRFKGSKAIVKTFAAIDGQKLFEGIIKEYKDGLLTLLVEGEKEVNIEFDKIASANLTIDF